MITLERIYFLVGAFFAAMALLSAFDRSNARRLLNFVFWSLLAASFFAGKLIVMYFAFELLLHTFSDRVKQLGLLSLAVLFGLGIRMWL